MKKNVTAVLPEAFSVAFSMAFLALSFLVGPLSIESAFSQSKSCHEITAFKPRIILTDIQTHSPRLLALKMNDDRMTRDLLALTGRTPVDCKGCITDRFQPAQKQRARAYLIERIKAAGLEPKIERSKNPSSYEGGSGSSYGGYSGSSYEMKFKAVDWETISDSDLTELWHRTMISDLRRYLTRYLKWEDKPSVLKLITADMLKELMGMVDENSPTANDKLIGELEKAGLNLNFIRLDSKSLYEALIQGEKKRESAEKIAAEKAAKEKAEKEAARLRSSKEAKDATILTAEDEKKVINIITEIKGSQRPNEIIEIIAHYDTKTENAAGADDNGSGLVTTLELMRLMKKFPPVRTVRIIFSDREEIDSAGAEHHVKQILANKDEKVLAVIVPDMFGYSPLGKPKFVLELGAQKEYPNAEKYAQAEAFAKLMAKQWHLYTDRIADMSVLTFSAESNMGDHGAYWDEGIPAIFVAAPLRPENPANHTSRDKVENMNFLVFREVAHFLGEVLVRTAGSKLLATELPNEEDLAFLKRISRPAADLNDKAVTLYFEGSQPKKPAYEPSHYSGSGYSGGYSGGFFPGSSGSKQTSPSTTSSGPGAPLLSVKSIDENKPKAIQGPPSAAHSGPILPKRDAPEEGSQDANTDDTANDSITEKIFKGYRDAVNSILFPGKK